MGALGEGARHRPRRAHRGSVTVLAVAVIAVLLAAAVVATGLAGLVAVQHRVAAAADLAALSGAKDPERACAVARRVAADNSAELRACEVAGPVVTVEVAVEADAPFGLQPTIRSTARAGPADLGEAPAPTPTAPQALTGRGVQLVWGGSVVSPRSGASCGGGWSA